MSVVKLHIDIHDYEFEKELRSQGVNEKSLLAATNSYFDNMGQLVIEFEMEQE